MSDAADANVQDEEPRVHDAMKMTVSIADQEHQHELRRRSYELAVRRNRIRF